MANRPHSRAYLESILLHHPPSGAIGSRPHALTRTASGIGLSLAIGDNYKPAKSSGLAIEGSGREDDGSPIDSRDGKDGSVSGISLTPAGSSLGSTSEDDDYEEPNRYLHIQTTPVRSSFSSYNNTQSIQSILQVLDDEEMDDEDRIEKARSLLAAALSEVEGSQVSTMRLDNVILALLHRHREDVRPTGASFTVPASPSPSPFPASPRSRPRPASLRSFTGVAAPLSRPWTPSLPHTPTSATMSHDNGPSSPSSPLLIPQTINIGNGSPRASPSLWHRSLSNSTSFSANTNPWSNSSPAAGSTFSFAPLGPPGETIGSPPKSALSQASGIQSNSSVASPSRPSSPGPNAAVDSPRLRVAALEFKPRAPSQTGPQQKSAPWLVDGKEGGVKSTSTSGDSDEDEFSPFVSQGAETAAVPVPGSSSSSASSRQVMGRTRPISGASGNSSIQSLTTADSVSGSYQGSNTSTSLESSDDQRSKAGALSGEEDLSSLSMTPFEVLSSILSTSTAGASSWTNEELEEALEVNNWDIDSTLSAIMDSGGMPSAVTTKIKGSTAPGQPTSGGNVPTGMGRSGVSLVSRDSFALQRATPGNLLSPPTEGNGSTTSPTGQSLKQQQLQQQQQQQAGGATGPGRVCRYFLAGECRRADCRFSHDLNRAVCRFWMKGQCLNGEGCSFLHDMSVVDKLTSRLSTTSLQDAGNGGSAVRSGVETPPNDEFPELSMAPTGPRAQRGKGAMAASAPDPSRVRWAQALQRRTNSPMTLIHQGDAHVPLHRKGPAAAPAKGIPTGPKGSIKNISVHSSRVPLHAPMLLPTLPTGQDASQSYTVYRDLAISLSEKRNQMLMKAAEAWKRGDGAEAKKWSREAQNVNLSMQDESRTASRKILRERHEEIQRRLADDSPGARGLMDPSLEERGSRGWRGKMIGDRMGVCLGVVPRVQGSFGNTMTLSLEERLEVLLDLHLMHSTEALEIIEDFLINLEREHYRGLALLAVGLGKHTSQATDRRRVGLAAAVKDFLTSWNYPHSDHNGVIVVDPLSHL